MIDQILLQNIYQYVIPAVAAVIGTAYVILLVALKMCPTAWFLVTKKLGIAKRGKGYSMVAWDDRIIQTEAMNVAPEGAMEKRKKKFGSLTFYLAKPQDDTANVDDNLKNERRDRDVLPPYYLDGVLPVYFSHVSKAVATNPKALVALRLGNRVDADSPQKFEADVVLPEEALHNGGEPLETNVMPVNVLLNFDPVDIKKNFSGYWQQANIDATKRRHQNIGAEKERADRKDFFKMILVACVMGSIIIAAVTIASNIFGG